jgi:surface antigen
MRRRLLATGIAAIALMATAVPGQSPPAETPEQQAEADARAQALKARTDAEIAAQRDAQQRYEQGLRDAEAERLRYEAEMARHREELERGRAAQEDYRRRMEEYEVRYGAGRGAAGRDADRGARDANATGSAAERADAARAPSGRTCEQQQRRNRNRGRAIGALVGGVAALSGVADDLGPGALALVPAGALLGDLIAGLLDCDEQERAAAATERAVAGGVGTTETWTSETRPGVSGSSTVLALEPEAGGGECMTVTDVVIVDGEETRAPKRLCRRPPSTRFVRV